MTFRPMKPETVAKKARERAKEREERRAAMLRDMREKAERDGPGSFWADMLAEAEGRVA